jgi:hypothetical protein
VLHSIAGHTPFRYFLFRTSFIERSDHIKVATPPERSIALVLKFCRRCSIDFVKSCIPSRREKNKHEGGRKKILEERSLVDETRIVVARDRVIRGSGLL